MRQMSNKTVLLLNFLKRHGCQKELLREFGFREAGAIPGFMALCFKWSELSAWTFLDKWIQTISLEDLQWLDNEFRRRSYTLGLELKGYDPELPFYVRCLLTFHVDGKVREEAIQQIGLNSDGRELPFLLIRLNDWVHHIQSIAKNIIYEKLKIENYAEYFLRNIFLAERLKHCMRWSHIDVLREIQKSVVASNSQSVRKVIESGDRASSLAAFNLYESVFPDDLRGITTSAFSSRHPRLHLKCANKIESLDDEEFLEVQDFMLKSRPPIRVAAMRSYCARFPDKAESFLKESLLDSSSMVRTFVVWSLKERSGDFDVAQFYRDELTKKVTEVGVSALGQFGDKDDAGFFLSLLNSKQSKKVYNQALTGYSKFGGEDSKAFLYQYVDKEGYSKIIVKALSDKINTQDSDKLMSIYIDGNDTARKNVKRLLVNLPDSDLGVVYLKLAVKFKEFVEPLIQFLSKSSFYCSRKEKREDFLRIYEINKDCFESNIQAALELSIKYWR